MAVLEGEDYVVPSTAREGDVQKPDWDALLKQAEPARVSRTIADVFTEANKRQGGGGASTADSTSSKRELCLFVVAPAPVSRELQSAFAFLVFFFLLVSHVACVTGTHDEDTMQASALRLEQSALLVASFLALAASGGLLFRARCVGLKT